MASKTVTEISQAKPPSWDAFVSRELLIGRVVSGVCLVSRRGLPVYTYGDLEHLQMGDLQQFLKLFQSPSSEDAFVIPKRGGRTTDFKVYKRTFCSLYATAPGNQEGLVVSNLPQGILLCIYRHPVQSGTAVKHIEHFCDMLRA